MSKQSTTAQGFKKPGFHLARHSGSPSSLLLVRVSGEAPFLRAEQIWIKDKLGQRITVQVPSWALLRNVDNLEHIAAIEHRGVADDTESDTIDAGLWWIRQGACEELLLASGKGRFLSLYNCELERGDWKPMHPDQFSACTICGRVDP